MNMVFSSHSNYASGVQPAPVFFKANALRNSSELMSLEFFCSSCQTRAAATQEAGPMKINSKTKTFCFFTATPSWLTTCLLLGALFVFAGMLRLSAQNVVLTGGLSGRVTDQSGAVVRRASVVVRNVATGVDQSAGTNHEGL
jgi:hypothetical protein